MRRPQRPPEAPRLQRPTQRRQAAARGRQRAAVRTLWLSAASVLWGCATVTQEDPPSHVNGASGAASNLPSSAGGGGNSAPLADMPALPEATPIGSPRPADSPDDRMPPVAAGGSSGGSLGAATPAPDAGPQFTSGMQLLEENFENFQAATGAWATSPGSTWEVRTDPQLVSNVYTQTETMSSTPDLATAGDVGWRDVVVEADLQILGFNGSSSSYMAGLCVRVRDAQDFYLVGVRSNDGKVGLRRYANGGTNLVQSSFDQGTTGKWYHLRVEVIGSTISAFLDGAMMFTTTDSTLASGGIALCTVRASASFDNVSVTAP